MLASSSSDAISDAISATSLELCSFDYAIVRVVPRVEREEFFNAGVIVFCAAQRFLQSRIELDRARLQVLAPDMDAETVEEYLQAISVVCEGGRNSGPIGQMGQTARFHWLVAPRSTIIQISPVHSGLCHDPLSALEQLFEAMVRSPRAA